MDRTAINELWTFTDYAWRSYDELLRPQGDAFLTRPAPGSGWPALANALTHINWAYVRWLQQPLTTTDEPPPAITSWSELDRYRRRVRDHARAYLDSLDDHELTALREMAVDDETLRYSPADVFAHALLHERQHHGDLNTLLYQLGFEVPVVEYRFSLQR